MISKIVSFVMLLFIKMYKNLLSPILPPSCRYLPSCSDYGAMAIQKYGPFKGGWLAFKRVLRCHPLGGHGYDPIP